MALPAVTAAPPMAESAVIRTATAYRRSPVLTGAVDCFERIYECRATSDNENTAPSVILPWVHYKSKLFQQIQKQFSHAVETRVEVHNTSVDYQTRAEHH